MNGLAILSVIMHVTGREGWSSLSRMRLLQRLTIEALWEATRTWILPFAIPAVGAVMGWFQDIPLFYLYVSVVVMFASACTGLARFSEWRYENRVEDKLIFHNIRVTIERNANGKVGFIKLGFIVHNSAKFPIQFRVEKLNSQFMEDFPPKKEIKRDGLTVAPGNVGWFDDEAIVPTTLLTIGQYAKGSIQFCLKYGRPNLLDCTLSGKKNVFFRFDNGDVRWEQADG